MACQASGPGDAAPIKGQQAPAAVRHWGGMRTVLREGRSEGRVELASVLGPHSVAVGALAGLAAEITVDGGRAHLSEVLDASAPDGLRVRAPRPGEMATLLVLADVPRWSEHELSAAGDLSGLEQAVRSTAEAQGLDVRAPFPFRVEGLATTLELHVLDRSCPIAHPDGPPPWRLTGADERVVLVGFHAQGAGGTLTHHGQATHTHAILTQRDLSGHLDAIALAPGARLFLPATP